MEPMTMTVLMTNVGEFFTKSVEWLGEVLDVVTGNPALLVMVLAMPIAGFAIGALGRLIRL